MKKKALVYVYIIWLATNLTAWAYAMGNPHISYGIGEIFEGHKDTTAFYPFESYDIGNYDFSEFIVYTIAVPLFLFAIAKLVLLFIQTKHSTTQK
jgi:hypothetical protein